MDTLGKTDDFYPYVKEIIRNQAIVLKKHPSIILQWRLKNENCAYIIYISSHIMPKTTFFSETSAMPNGVLYMLLSKLKRCQSNLIQKIYIGETVDVK